MNQTQEVPVFNPDYAQQNWEEIFNRFGELGMNIGSTQRAEHLSVINGEGLMDVATRVHEVVVPGVEHTPTDYTMGVGPPDGDKRPLMGPRDRAPFLEHAASLVRELAATRKPGEDENFLKRASNVVALSLELAHPFAEGNGRTARTVAHLIRDGYDGTPESQHDFQTVGANRPPSGFRINSYLPTGKGRDMSPVEVINAAAALSIPLSDHEAYNTMSWQTFSSPYSD